MWVVIWSEDGEQAYEIVRDEDTARRRMLSLADLYETTEVAMAKIEEAIGVNY